MKKNIAIIMGGYSSEYLISLKSGGVVYDSLPKISYNAYCIHIFKDKWVYVAEDLTERPVDKADFSINVAGSKITFDCVFNKVRFSKHIYMFWQEACSQETFHAFHAYKNVYYECKSSG